MMLIPVSRQGTVVPANAKVDDEDHAMLLEHIWRLHPKGYAYTGRHILMHRMILGLEPGDPRQGDHLNFDKLDNRRANLRVVTHGENQQHRAGPQANSQSGHRGVVFDPRKRDRPWRARVMVNRQRYESWHASEQEAADAAQALRSEHQTEVHY